VVNISLGLLLATSWCEQKKLTPRIFFLLQALAMVHPIVVFPVLADPLIQNVQDLAIASAPAEITSDSVSDL